MNVGDKCVKLTRSTGGLNADVVPAIACTEVAQDPIQIWSRRLREERSNFPRRHYDNGVTKQARTLDSYKATVRLSERRERAMRAEGTEPVCRDCRRPPRPRPDSSDYAFWTTRFSMDEIRLLAGRIWGSA